MLEIRQEVIDNYKNTLMSNLSLYIKYDKLTLDKASDILSSSMDNIFGTSEHAGIVHYIIAKEGDIKEDDAVSAAEKRYNLGWRVRKDGRKYILFDERYDAVSDMSDKSSIRDDSSIEYVEEESYNLLSPDTASLIGKLAGRRGIPPSDMVSPSAALSMIERFYGVEHDAYPEVQGYSAVGKILRKYNFFSGGSPMNTMRRLHEKDMYVIESVTNPTTLPVAYLSNGTSHISMRPVTSYKEVEERYYKELSTYEKLYIPLGIKVEKPEVLSDMGYIYAFYFERPREHQDIGELVRLLRNIEGTSYKDKIFSSLAAIFVTENVVRKHNTGLEGIRIDTVKLGVTLKFLTRDSLRKEEYLLSAIESGKKSSDFFSAIKGIQEKEESHEFAQGLGYLISILPESYGNLLEGVDKSNITSTLLLRIEQEKL